MLGPGLEGVMRFGNLRYGSSILLGTKHKEFCVSALADFSSVAMSGVLTKSDFDPKIAAKAFTKHQYEQT